MERIRQLAMTPGESSQGLMAAQDTREQEWLNVKERLEKCAQEKSLSSEMEKILLILGKYDYFGAPSNWSVGYHEQIIYEWAVWVDKNRKEYAEQLSICEKQYSSGIIPDCFDMMMDYFT
jgi:hypothetical protein